MTDPVGIFNIPVDKLVELISNNALGALCLVLFYLIRRDSDRRDEDRKQDFNRLENIRAEQISQYRLDAKENRESNIKLTDAINELTMSVKILTRTERAYDREETKSQGLRRSRRDT